MIDVIWESLIDKADYKHYPRREIGEIRGVMLHRVGKDYQTGADFGDTAEEICQAFTEGPAARYTGHKLPYSFIVEEGGRVAQCLPVTWVGPHALKKSVDWLSVAFIGDFRDSEPSEAQNVSGTILVRGLLGMIGKGIAAIEGHTNVPGATGDPRKQCPGKGLNLHEVKRAIAGGFAL